MVNRLGQNIGVRGVAASGFCNYDSRRQELGLPRDTLQPRKRALAKTACGGQEEQRQILQGEGNRTYETIDTRLAFVISWTSRVEICRIEVKDAGNAEIPGLPTEDFVKLLEALSR